MKLVILFSILFSFFGAKALKLEFVNSTVIEHKRQLKKTKIGGLSGMIYDDNDHLLYAVSDDRGKVNEPRIYVFSVKLDEKNFSVNPEDVIILKNLKAPYVDMEGLTILPWGNFLISTEGDMNHKPRIFPELMDVKKSGVFVRDFSLPDSFLPPLAGEQKKGVKNNRGLEGLTRSPSGEKYFVSAEQSLIQDKDSRSVPLLQYEMKEAWVLTQTNQFQYEIEKQDRVDPLLENGVSEILALDDHLLLVLERALKLSKEGLQYKAKIFSFNLTTREKKFVFDFDEIKEKISNKIENFEAMTLGPLLAGQKTIIVAADDNFKKNERNLFVLFKLKE